MNLTGGLNVVTTINNDPNLALWGARSVSTAVIGGVRHVFVASWIDGGLQVLTMANNGTLTPTITIEDSPALGLNGAWDIEVVQVNANLAHVVVSGRNEAALNVFSFEPGGVWNAVQTVTNASLLGNISGLAQAMVGSTRYIVATAGVSNTLSVWSLSNAGTLTNVSSRSLADFPAEPLAGLTDATTVVMGGTTYVVALGAGGTPGIGVYSLAANGTLTHQWTYAQTSLASGHVHSVVVDGTTYVVIGSLAAGGQMQAFSMAANGALTSVAVQDTSNSFGRFIGIVAFSIEGIPMLAVSDDTGARIGIFSLTGTEGFLLSSVINVPFSMIGAAWLGHEEINGRHFLLVPTTNHITSFEIAGGNDVIVGTNGADRAAGLNGHDEIILLGGNDLAYGGGGDDLISGGNGRDTLFGGAGDDTLIGGNGNDILEGGAGADMLIGGAGVDTAAYTTSNQRVIIDLAAGTATGGHAAGDILIQIQNLTGSAFNDSLAGNGQDNRLEGGAGNDTLRGGAGDDTLDGGEGRDSLAGGNGDDVLIGGRGADTMSGGNGADIFVFANNFGNDIITDFTPGTDRIDLKAVNAVSSWVQLQPMIAASGGDTLITIGNHSIRLNGVSVAALDEGDFLF